MPAHGLPWPAGAPRCSPRTATHITDPHLPAQVVAPDGRRLVTCKGAPQIVRDLLQDGQARQAVDRYCQYRMATPQELHAFQSCLYA